MSDSASRQTLAGEPAPIAHAPVTGPFRVPLRGHWWTLRPYLGAATAKLRGRAAPSSPASPWRTIVRDPAIGAVELSGSFRRVASSRAIVVLVHGLGGRADSVYVERAARQFTALGYSTLALALRGADRRGDDFYNVGLTADLHAAFASPELSPFESIFVVGFSMGGHVTIHCAADHADPRLRAVAAICTPLHLKSAQLHIDSNHVAFYRRWVLRGLKDIYAANAARGERPLPSSAAAVRAVTTVREWDRLTVAPRYGYRNPDHYYEDASAAHRLDALRCPTLLVLVDTDPIIPPGVVMPFVPARSEALTTVRVPTGGHLSFSRNLDLGWGPERGLEGQLAGWFERPI